MSCGILDGDRLERLLELAAPARRPPRPGGPPGALFPGLDVEPLALADLALALDRLVQKLLASLAVLGGAGQAPVGHGVLRLELEAPAEGPLGLVVPEVMQQRVALVEPALHLGVPGGDREVGAPDALDDPGLLPGTDVEGVPVARMPPLRLLRGLRRRRAGQRRPQQEEAANLDGLYGGFGGSFRR